MTTDSTPSADDFNKKLHGKDAETTRTYHEWSENTRQKYNRLHEVVLDNLPGMWRILEFALPVKSILNIKDCNLPFAGILLGPAGSLKTACIELFRGYKYSFYTDHFTAKALVSHSSGVDEKKLKDIDMLPKINNKLFLSPELAPIFASKDDDLLQVLGTLTRVADGHGYESDTGAQGHRGYSEKMMFAWLGAAVEVPHKVHKHLAVLGPRLYFFRLPREEHTEEEYLYYCQNVSDHFNERLDRIRYALYDYLAYFELHPNIEQEPVRMEDEVIEDQTGDGDGDDNGNGKRKRKVKTKVVIPPPPKIPFTGKAPEEIADKDTVDRYLIKLAELLARLRAIVPTWYTRDTQGSDYAYGTAIIEEPHRAITQLRNLARGHALSQGRDYITVDDDIPLLIKVVMSTASIERSLILDILIASNGTLTTSEICSYLNTTKPTALRTMTELKAVGLVDKYEGDNNTETRIELKSEFGWLLTDRFEELKSRKEKNTPETRCNFSPNLQNLLYESNIMSKVSSLTSMCVPGGENSLREVTNDMRFCCKYCDFKTNDQSQYDHHTVKKHPGTAGYG